MTTIRAGLTSFVLAIAASLSTVALATPAGATPDMSAQPVRCVGAPGYVPPNYDGADGDFLGSSFIRTDPAPRCTAIGQGESGHGADYFCYVDGEGGTWTYVRDLATGKTGWVFDGRLTGRGSTEPCEPELPELLYI